MMNSKSEELLICASEALPEGGRASKMTEDALIVVFRVEGALYAIDARCPHVGAPMDEGFLEGTVLTCPFHGARFDIATGQTINGPAYSELETLDVFERDGEVYVNIAS